MSNPEYDNEISKIQARSEFALRDMKPEERMSYTRAMRKWARYLEESIQLDFDNGLIYTDEEQRALDKFNELYDSYKNIGSDS